MSTLISLIESEIDVPYEQLVAIAEAVEKNLKVNKPPEEGEKVSKKKNPHIEVKPIEAHSSSLIKEDYNDFLSYCQDNIGYRNCPEIIFCDSKEEAMSKRSFGSYQPSDKKIYINTAGRHPVDVMRTLAHELVHHWQNEEGRIKPDSGGTGSDIENEANALAAVLMRNYGRQNPKIYEAANSLQRVDRWEKEHTFLIGKSAEQLELERNQRQNREKEKRRKINLPKPYRRNRPWDTNFDDLFIIDQNVS